MTATPLDDAPAPSPVLPDLSTVDVVDLTRIICDIPSVSGDETALADAIEAALSRYDHLEVLRDGDAVVARTHLGRAERVVIAGHIDTVPVQGNLPVQVRPGEGSDAGDDVLWGRGTVDMLGGVAVQLHLAARLTAPTRDVTWVFYDHEEVASDLNGLGRIVRTHPDWVRGDVAILCEPTRGDVEGGCNGTLRLDVTLRGRTAHSARAWMGHNAVHDAWRVLERLAVHTPAEVEVDGLRYRESLNAVAIRGGIAGNMIPDTCVVEINYRFAPSRSVDDAVAYVLDVLAGIEGLETELTDAAAGARPGLDHPAAQEFLAAVREVTGAQVMPKYGWTDVARFTELGVPAVNFGPGDPLLAHADDERCPARQIRSVAAALEAWLDGESA
ncbi:succinyl-diaminopimelate desuccinylase [Beutenbergia cavernae]|uniref:succinyl-diaminopimelate desuccinylase n=1 Tax=Beutenbergia cavernae TaxID=84757 RepID=UPI000682F0BD|nr:succinyl-diaminopimelate desuccinylase [Beutenbergia cavernae]